MLQVKLIARHESTNQLCLRWLFLELLLPISYGFKALRILLQLVNSVWAVCLEFCNKLLISELGKEELFLSDQPHSKTKIQKKIKVR